MPLRPVISPDPTSEIVASDTTSPHLKTWQQVLVQIREFLAESKAHPARSVVLLPYVQLVPLASSLWAAHFPDGFAPRFETTRTWAARVGLFSPGPNDIALDHGRDLLTATSLLEGAGLGPQRALLVGPLVEQAMQLAPLAASVPSGLRPEWAEQVRAAVPDLHDGPLALEAAVARIAIAWAAASDYATDVLFEPRIAQGLDALIVVNGLQPDELSSSLLDHFSDKSLELSLETVGPAGKISCHAAKDGEDEAQRAAACVLQHVSQGRVPVALTAGDRLLTRRISALLNEKQVRIRDETGWKLSTTHAAAQVMSSLRSCARHASTDTVIDWLKLAPAFAEASAWAIRRLERSLRKSAIRDWASVQVPSEGDSLIGQVNALLEPMRAPRRLPDWLSGLQECLEGAGLWSVLNADSAGEAILDALGMHEAERAELRTWPAAQRKMSLGEFTSWVSDALEAVNFRPPAEADAEVVILPMSQLLGRPFAALVLPGADEQRLPVAPEPTGPWTAAQRLAMRLPTRQVLEAAQRAAWNMALNTPHMDLLWRGGDDSGEPLLPSPLIQALLLAQETDPGTDAREFRRLDVHPVSPPKPRGDALPAMPLSASSYDMLRLCPYRFFALRQLGLQDEGELDVDVDKRDFGNWVHAALRRFHEALQVNPQGDRVLLLDQAAVQARQDQGLDEAEFLPYSVGWAALREGYLKWLAEYETSGAVFEAAEKSANVTLGKLELKGQLDRIDRLPSGDPLVLDYKTESLAKTKDRIKAGGEDTQLAFYALLTASDQPRAAYLNVSEREGTSMHEPPDLLELAARLHSGMESDIARIQQGAPLLALGEGSVCGWCEARGLCRKDFWSGE